MSGASGLVVVDKPAGFTSHQMVGRARRLFGTRKIGHAGTLDPMATGVLILGVNRATRLLGHLALNDKRYLATVRLGESSDTDDADGDVSFVADASRVTREDLEAALAASRGVILQVPSSVSAIKVDGQRAYKLAREGRALELAAREVEVTRLDVLDVRPSDGVLDVDIDVECSSGTYIRAIARDLGRTLGVGGHLTSLRRTRIGPFGLDEAVVLDAEAPALLSMVVAARRSFACLDVDVATADAIRHGCRLELQVPAPVTGMVVAGDELLALYRPDGEGSRPVAVFV